MQERIGMVSYQAWVSICFEALQDRGVQVSDLDDGASMMQFAADTWTQHGSELKRASAAEARSHALQLARTY